MDIAHDRQQAATGPTRSQVGLFLVSVAFYWMSLYLYVPILSPYVEFLQGSLVMVGLVVASYGLSQFILRIPVGIWSDWIGVRKPFVLSGFIAAGAAGFGMAVATTPGTLLAFRALSGVAATMWVPITVLFSSYFPPNRAPYAMGVIMMVTTVSQLVATFSGGLIAEWWGWQAPFWMAAVLGMMGFVSALGVKEGRAVERPALSLRELVRVGREPRLLAISALGALYQYIMFVTVYGFTPNYAVSLGAGKAELGVLMLASSLPAAVAAYGSGAWLTRRFREIGLVAVGFFVTAIMTVVIPSIHSISMLYLSQAIGGIGRGVIFPVLMGLSIKTVPEERRATAMGFFQSLYAIGMLAGPAASGFIGSAVGMTGIFWTAGIVGCLGLVLSWAANRRG